MWTIHQQKCDELAQTLCNKLVESVPDRIDDILEIMPVFEENSVTCIYTGRK